MEDPRTPTERLHGLYTEKLAAARLNVEMLQVQGAHPRLIEAEKHEAQRYGDLVLSVEQMMKQEAL